MAQFIDVAEQFEEPLGVGMRHCSYEESAPLDVYVTMKDLVITEYRILPARPGCSNRGHPPSFSLSFCIPVGHRFNSTQSQQRGLRAEQTCRP